MTRECLLKLDSQSVDETIAIGQALGACLRRGDTVGLTGPLGAGKTHLIKGIAVGLGVADDRFVNSPTFVLINEYEGRVHVYHVDAYRLSGLEELRALGFEEMCLDGVVLLEWADRVAGAFEAETLWIDIAVNGEARRRLTLSTSSASFGERLLSLRLDRGREAAEAEN